MPFSPRDSPQGCSKSDVIFYDLTSAQIEAIEEVTDISDLDTARVQIDPFVSLPRTKYAIADYHETLAGRLLADLSTAKPRTNATGTTGVGATVLATDFLVGATVEEIFVSAASSRRMKAARDGNIKVVVKGTSNGLQEVAQSCSTNCCSRDDQARASYGRE
jgi:hypothetical protein